MEKQENQEKQKKSVDIYNYFQGATINNLVINGNMTKSGPDQFHNGAYQGATVTPDMVAQALKACKDYMWGNASVSVAFCVCRDAFSMGDNACSFERMLRERGFDVPDGTINSAFYRNEWMKYHIDRWEEMDVMERVIKLRDAFKEQMNYLLLPARKTA